MYLENNQLCEICIANPPKFYDGPTMDMYWINTHCIELRRNRESRKNKNIKTKSKAF